jgi:hypothetical protein
LILVREFFDIALNPHAQRRLRITCADGRSAIQQRLKRAKWPE